MPDNEWQEKAFRAGLNKTDAEIICLTKVIHHYKRLSPDLPDCISQAWTKPSGRRFGGVYLTNKKPAPSC